MKKLNVAIIGGSFNPVTNGHLQLGLFVSNIDFIDEVWYVPNYKSVFGKDLESWTDRIVMLQKAISYLYALTEHKVFRLSNIEAEYDLDGYTITLSQKLKELYKNVNFYFAIGQDIANNIHKYKYYDKLIDELNFIIIPRKGYTPTNEWYLNDKHIYKKLDESLIEVSSSEVRKYIRTNEIWKLLTKIPLEVLDYIKINHLYKK